MTFAKVTLGRGESIHVVIDGLTVSVTHVVDDSGGHALQLGGVDCNLEGELPGLYYPAARGSEVS